MKPFVRFTILLFAVLFLRGAAFTWFDVMTHENTLTHLELKFASGWLMTGLMFLGSACAAGDGASVDPSRTIGLSARHSCSS